MDGLLSWRQKVHRWSRESSWFGTCPLLCLPGPARSAGSTSHIMLCFCPNSTAFVLVLRSGRTTHDVSMRSSACLLIVRIFYPAPGVVCGYHSKSLSLGEPHLIIVCHWISGRTTTLGINPLSFASGCSFIN